MSNTIKADLLVIGGAHIDRVGRSSERLEPAQSNPGRLRKTVGGVGGNIAQCLTRLDWSIALSSICGDDTDGLLIKERLEAANIDLSEQIRNSKHSSATYTAIEDSNGALIAAIADMEIYDAYPAEAIPACLEALPESAMIIADTNLPAPVLLALAKHKKERHLSISAVSGPKANRAADILHDIDLLFCNEAEAAILAEEFAELDALPEILKEAGVRSGVITKGDAGLSAWHGHQSICLPAPPVKVRSTNGAGDTLAACILHGLLLERPFEQALALGMAGANLSLMSDQSVPDILNRALLEACVADIPQSQ